MAFITCLPSFICLSYQLKVKPIKTNYLQRRSLISTLRTPLRRAEKSSKEAIDDAFKRSAKRGPITWVSLTLVALTGGGLLLYVRHLKEEKEQGKVWMH